MLKIFKRLKRLFKKAIMMETRFSKLPIDQKFKKIGDNRIYIKSKDDKYETLMESYHPIHWFKVLEDFEVEICS